MGLERVLCQLYFTGRECFEVTEGEVCFNGKNLLDLPAEDRAREGIF